MTDNFLRTPWRMEGSSAVDCAGLSLVGRFCLGSNSKDWPALVEAVNAGCAVLEMAGKDTIDREEILNVRDMVLGGGDLPGSKPEEGRRALAYLDGIEARVEALRQDAFDLGHKAAGGTIIPDGARNMIELALDRDQINALAQSAEDSICDGTFTYLQDEALKRFLENISIYRRKR